MFIPLNKKSKINNYNGHLRAEEIYFIFETKNFSDIECFSFDHKSRKPKVLEQIFYLLAILNEISMLNVQLLSKIDIRIIKTSINKINF